MIRFPLTGAALAAGALALSLGAFAQSSPSSAAASATAQGARSSAKSEVARADRKFIETAAMGGMAEVALAKAAQTKASSAQVRAFAQRMVTDHTKANEELMALASAKGVPVPAALDRSHRNDLEKISKRSGADFDREYVAHEVSDHRKTVSDFNKAADSARDPELKAWAAKTLPTLQEHHKSAQALHDELKGKGASKS